ncbi:fetuin-B-like [Erpetoichthys calabaricus]|uniref:Fetuin-B-like n=1 Tax=Erpetoichthys calabaricus TaxID=27687 RepID=A0A8C4S6A5_ERPCA|nr:fetuin-B-like [Erpetoichthys calabaricus]
MKLLVLTVVGTLLGAAWSLPVVPDSAPLQAASCNDSQVTIAADLAVREINKRQDEGNVLVVYRINDAHIQNKGMGNTFYLDIYVVDTDCPVVSRKDGKQCKTKPIHETLYGDCHAVIHINRVSREILLYSYNCTLIPPSSKTVLSMCPDCPLRVSKGGDRVMGHAKQTLLKYNKESNHTKVFNVKEILGGSTQLLGSNFYVKYTVYETGCTKENLSEDFICKIENPVKRFGLCEGSEMIIAAGPTLSVDCEIYATEEMPNICHMHGHGHGSSHEHGHDHHHHGPGHDHHHHGPGHDQSPHGPREGKEREQQGGHGHDHQDKHNHGHSHESGHKDKNDHGHGHGHDKKDKHHKHDHQHGHDKHNHTHSHGSGKHESHEHSHEHGHHNHTDDHACRRPSIGSVLILPQTSDPIDLPEPIVNLPEFAKKADILPFPDQRTSSSLCPGESKLPIRWISEFNPIPK